MATDEFEQTGRTSGQRLYAIREKHPPSSRSTRLTASADKMASRMLEKNPSMGELNQQLKRQREGPPPADRFADLSEREMRAVLRQLQGKPSTMDATLAEQVSRDLADG